MGEDPDLIVTNTAALSITAAVVLCVHLSGLGAGVKSAGDRVRARARCVFVCLGFGWAYACRWPVGVGLRVCRGVAVKHVCGG